MKNVELTCRERAATHPPMRNDHDTHRGLPAGVAVLALVAALATSGCISVNAPDKPIVIELNMNITMDVVYKLSGDATRTVDTNKDIF